MHSLREMQRAFARSVLSDDGAPLAGLIHRDGINPEERVRIYRNNNRLGLLAALRASYPVVARLGGDDWFAQSVRRYQRACPPHCGDLQWAGHRYPQFLSAELGDGEHDYFADVAALEWAHQEVLVAAETAAVDPAALRDCAVDDYGRLVFAPRAELRLVRSRYPIHAIWRAHQTEARDFTVDLAAGASHVLVIRRRDHVELRELAPATHALLARLCEGRSLGEVVDHVASRYRNFDLSPALRELFALRTFAAIRLAAV
jgi:hypothetical protein